MAPQRAPPHHGPRTSIMAKSAGLLDKGRDNVKEPGVFHRILQTSAVLWRRKELWIADRLIHKICLRPDVSIDASPGLVLRDIAEVMKFMMLHHVFCSFWLVSFSDDLHELETLAVLFSCWFRWFFGPVPTWNSWPHCLRMASATSCAGGFENRPETQALHVYLYPPSTHKIA